MKLLQPLLYSSILLASLSGCKSWTQPEPIFHSDLTRSEYVSQDGEDLDPLDPAQIDAIIARDAASPYYTALRQWKKEGGHEVAFGYYGNHTGKGTDYEFSMRGLPDSVDFVSLWGGWNNLDPIRAADVRYAREVKGIRSLACLLIFEVGDRMTPAQPQESIDAGISYVDYRRRYWGWTYQDNEGKWVSDLDSQKKAVIKYANAVADAIIENNLDGLDIDAEPSYAQPFETTSEMWTPVNHMNLFVETLGKKIGPMAETEEGRSKILAVDGEPEAFAPEMGKYFDYFIIQAYGDSSHSMLNSSRFGKQVRHFGEYLTPEEISKKIIYVANFESYASTGGVSTADGPQLIMFANHVNEYQGKSYRKGGVGSFHMEYEYKVTGKTGTYPYLREAIQIMTPAVR